MKSSTEIITFFNGTCHRQNPTSTYIKEEMPKHSSRLMPVLWRWDEVKQKSGLKQYTYILAVVPKYKYLSVTFLNVNQAEGFGCIPFQWQESMFSKFLLLLNYNMVLLHFLSYNSYPVISWPFFSPITATFWHLGWFFFPFKCNHNEKWSPLLSFHQLTQSQM